MRQPASIVVALFAAASFAFAARQAPPTQPASPPPPTEPPQVGEQSPAPPPVRKPSARQRAKHIKEITGVIESEGGTIAFKLEPNKCPLLCANFCNLVRKGFFDGRQWRDFTRVIRQVGTDQVWYALPREFDPTLFFDRGGMIAMSKDIDDTTKAKAHGTRFFISVKPQERWNLDYPIFGYVTSGLNVLIDMKSPPPDLSERHETIKSITVSGDVDALLEAFAPEVAEWNAALEAASQRGAR